MLIPATLRGVRNSLRENPGSVNGKFLRCRQSARARRWGAGLAGSLTNRVCLRSSQSRRSLGHGVMQERDFIARPKALDPDIRTRAVGITVCKTARACTASSIKLHRISCSAAYQGCLWKVHSEWRHQPIDATHYRLRKKHECCNDRLKS